MVKGAVAYVGIDAALLPPRRGAGFLLIESSDDD